MKGSGRTRRARLVNWNGEDLPPEFRDLPPGRHMVTAVDDETAEWARVALQRMLDIT